jgi:hypothetical protein
MTITKYWALKIVLAEKTQNYVLITSPKNSIDYFPKSIKVYYLHLAKSSLLALSQHISVLKLGYVVSSQNRKSVYLFILRTKLSNPASNYKLHFHLTKRLNIENKRLGHSTSSRFAFSRFLRLEWNKGVMNNKSCFQCLRIWYEHCTFTDKDPHLLMRWWKLSSTFVSGFEFNIYLFSFKTLF